MLLKLLQFMRGGQIFGYSTTMMAQVTNRILHWAIIGYVLLVLLLMIYSSHEEIRLLALQAYCDFLRHLHYEEVIVWSKTGVGGFDAHYFLHSPAIQAAVEQAKTTLFKKSMAALITGAFIYCGITVFFTRFFIKKGEKYSQDKFISGTRLAKTAKEVVQSVEKSRRGKSDIRLLNQLPLPAKSEFQGIFFHGSTGTGKTQAIMRLLDEIRRLGEPAIIYDKECTIKPYFFNEATDVELNPVSALCANWDLWAECDNPMELGNLATYLIPKSVQGSDPFWVDSARTILTSTAWRMRGREDRSALTLLRLLLTTSLDEMRDLLKGTESENLVSKEIEKTAISIKSVLATYTKSLRFLEGLSGKDVFSIKSWLKEASHSSQTEKGWLFITSRSQYHREIKPLISLWLGLAMQGIQSLKANTGRRIWLIMDELASLHRLEMLSDTLADIRKFGGCVAIGIQSISQLEFLYGQHEAYAITDLFNTSVYFRSPKGRVARWVSEDLGEQTLDEVRESQSYGPNSIRDGNTMSTQRIKRKTVDEGEIMTLEDQECYIRLAGDHPIARMKSAYLKRKSIAESLIERPIDFDALDGLTGEILNAVQNPLCDDAVKKIQVFEQSANLILNDEKRLENPTGLDMAAINESCLPQKDVEIRL